MPGKKTKGRKKKAKSTATRRANPGAQATPPLPGPTPTATTTTPQPAKVDTDPFIPAAVIAGTNNVADPGTTTPTAGLGTKSTSQPYVTPTPTHHSKFASESEIETGKDACAAGGTAKATATALLFNPSSPTEATTTVGIPQGQATTADSDNGSELTTGCRVSFLDKETKRLLNGSIDRIDPRGHFIVNVVDHPRDGLSRGVEVQKAQIMSVDDWNSIFPGAAAPEAAPAPPEIYIPKQLNTAVFGLQIEVRNTMGRSPCRYMALTRPLIKSQNCEHTFCFVGDAEPLPQPQHAVTSVVATWAGEVMIVCSQTLPGMNGNLNLQEGARYKTISFSCSNSPTFEAANSPLVLGVEEVARQQQIEIGRKSKYPYCLKGAICDAQASLHLQKFVPNTENHWYHLLAMFKLFVEGGGMQSSLGKDEWFLPRRFLRDPERRFGRLYKWTSKWNNTSRSMRLEMVLFNAI